MRRLTRLGMSIALPALLVLPALTGACGRAPAPRDRPDVPAVVEVDAGRVASAEDADAGALPPEPEGLRTPERPRTEGCTFWSDRTDVSFVPSRDDSGTLGVRGARVKLELGSAGSWAEMETRDVRVMGVLPPNFVELHPRSSFLFDEASEVTGATTFYTPRPAGAAEVTLSLRFGDTQDRTRVVACDALTLAPVSGAEASRLAREPGLASVVVLGSFTKPTPVYDAKAGPVVSRLEHRRAAKVMAREQGRVEVVWEQDGTVQVGWVPAAAVVAPGTPLTEPGARVVTLDARQMRLSPDHAAPRPPPRPWPRTICREDVRLVAEHAQGTRWVIGVVKPGTPLALLHRWGAVWEVAPDALDLDVGEATRLYVPARDVARACASRAAP